MTIKDFLAPLAWGLGVAAKRTAMTLIVMILTATTAWAVVGSYTLNIESLYDNDVYMFTVEYDYMRDGYYITLNTPYFEERFNRQGDHHIIGYGYSSTGNPTIATNAEIQLTENPTTLYAFWDDSPHWEISDSGHTLTFYGDYVMENYDEHSAPWAKYYNDVTTIIINEGMTAIGDYAFYGFMMLMSVSLPSTLTSIGDSAFMNCNVMTSIEIPSNVSEIKQAAFAGSGLTSIDIPASVTTIGAQAFRCSGLASVTVCATTPPALGENAFNDNTQGRKIYVPGEALDTYKNAEDWSEYADDILPYGIPYIDADGNTAYRSDYIEITSDLNTIIEGKWYVVNSDVNFNLPIMSGPCSFILCDGKTLNSYIGISKDGQFTIYGQTEGSGQLKTDSEIKFENSPIIINGGTISANRIEGRGITIRRGSVTATANGVGNCGIKSNQGITITGGQITATSTGEGGYGISAADGITLGWTNASDFITASSYNGTVTIAEGKAFADEDGNIYSGTISDPSVLNGKKLTPAIIMMDNADNCDAIKKYEYQQLSVQLQGRTLYRDGDWNTLSLPFDLGDSKASKDHWFDGTPLEGATVMTLDVSENSGTGFDANTGTLTLNFAGVDKIEGGKPYIVKWGTTENHPATDLQNPVFQSVTIEDISTTLKSHDGSVSFYSFFFPTDIEGNSYLYLGAHNKLYWPSTERTMNAFRAYFKLNNGITAGEPAEPGATSGSNAPSITNFVLGFGDDGETTGIIEAEANSSLFTPHSSLSGWYDLQGRKLQSKPSTKGIYILNGNKVVIK